MQAKIKLFLQNMLQNIFRAEKRLTSIIFAPSSDYDRRDRNRTHPKEMRAKLRAICCAYL
jgi:hypothetical protein